ncbi:hypothetical protein [Entomospira entomophila]|uniref:hypothetical protein n=1 Tax=Entomospira entomophila TaxID=2719988 RepID=UPI0024810DFF|nr:hypothetical protein [Entomospira entomophilus]
MSSDPVMADGLNWYSYVNNTTEIIILEYEKILQEEKLGYGQLMRVPCIDRLF